MFRVQLAPVLIAGLSLQACAVGPNYTPPASVSLSVPGGYSTPAPAGEPGDIQAWWTSFDDPLLTSIVERARTGNLDIAQAVSRLRQARESLVQSRADLLPSVSGSAGYDRSVFDSVGDRGSFSLGANVAYQADLFGGVRRGIEASRATYQASGYDLATVQTSIAAETARNYIAARQAQANLAIARGSLAIQDDNLEITGFRVQAGLVSSLDTEQSRQQRAQTAATIPTLEQNYQSAVNRLGVLTGQAPGALKAQLEAAAPIPKGLASIAAGIPADALRQRPDVRAAERRLGAATAQIGVAEAQLYPQLNITGNIATAATSVGGLASVITGSLFAGLTQLIFDGGRTRSRIRAQEAAAEGALASYKQVVLTALEDVENALTALRTAKEREAQFVIALDASNNAAILSRSQYRAGLTDITTLNTNESALLSAQNGLSNARADQALAVVQLYLALGGGWDSGTIPVAPTTAVMSPGPAPSPAPAAPAPISQE